MKSRRRLQALGTLFVLVVFILNPLSTASAAVEASEPEVIEGIYVGLVDKENRPLSRFPIAPDTRSLPEVNFKVTLPTSITSVKSWALEVTEPTRKASIHLDYDGSVPEVIHWNGLFTDGTRIQPGSRYFIRIQLTLASRRVASDWSFFVVELQALELDRSSHTMALSVAPSLSAELALLQSRDFRSVQFPLIAGEAAFQWKDRHALALRFGATSNIGSEYVPSSTGFFYSDISFSYWYRLSGSPLRREEPILTPSYVPKTPSAPGVSRSGTKSGIEVGSRLFITTIRGFGDQPIDGELARQMQGVSGLVRAEQRMGLLRLSEIGELGYSVFRGKILLLSGQAMLSYDGFTEISPTIQVRIQQYLGNAADDAFDGVAAGASESVVNRILFAGMTLQFKL